MHNDSVVSGLVLVNVTDPLALYFEKNEKMKKMKKERKRTRKRDKKKKKKRRKKKEKLTQQIQHHEFVYSYTHELKVIQLLLFFLHLMKFLTFLNRTPLVTWLSYFGLARYGEPIRSMTTRHGPTAFLLCVLAM